MTILEKLTKVFEEADAKSIAGIPEDVKSSRQWYRKLYKEILEEHGGNYTSDFYRELKTYASKQTQNDMQDSFENHVRRETKRTKDSHADRNRRIADKCHQYGIEDIDSDELEIIYGTDFRGEWLIDGHYVKLDVIWAGGYNVQCLHCRVTCKVSKKTD